MCPSRAAAGGRRTDAGVAESPLRNTVRKGNDGLRLAKTRNRHCSQTCKKKTENCCCHLDISVCVTLASFTSKFSM